MTKYLYPSMLNPTPQLDFDDQYAFRPTGSATAALIATINSVTELHQSGRTAVLLTLDFSKAFDRVRHKTLLEKYAMLDLEDCVYNWIVSYFEDRGHVTKFKGSVSGVKRINSSVVQGSGIGPASYSIAESDLHPKRKETFAMHKFADDVDLVTALENYNEIQDEIDHIESWAADNNLVLNKAKTEEIIFCKGRSAILPPITEGRERVTSFKKLGVTLQSTLSMKDHTDSLISACSNKLYALNTLRSQGLCKEGLQQVFKSKILSKLLYASPAWIGLAGKEERGRIDAFLRRSRKHGYYEENGRTFDKLCETADERLFNRMQTNSRYVLCKFLPDKQQHKYMLRKRAHEYKLPVKDDRNFINRILYK